MSAGQWLDRAERALRTARLAYGDGDADGACSKAYYAMFYAARAALFHVGQPDRALGKTHSGTIAAFHQFVVHVGLVDGEYGRSLSHEAQRRLIADYDAAGVEDDDAAPAIANAEAFVAAVKALIVRQGAAEKRDPGSSPE